MDYEMKLVRKQYEKLGLPMRDTPPTRFHPDESSARRRSVRVATDGLIRQGLMGSNITEVSVGIAETMTAAAGACVQFGLEPGLGDALAAAKELLEDARLVVDNGLALNEEDQVRVGVCMLEVVSVGIAACFGIPYKQVMDIAHSAYMEGKDIDRAGIQVMMERAMNVNKGAANEG